MVAQLCGMLKWCFCYEGHYKRSIQPVMSIVIMLNFYEDRVSMGQHACHQSFQFCIFRCIVTTLLRLEKFVAWIRGCSLTSRLYGIRDNYCSKRKWFITNGVTFISTIMCSNVLQPATACCAVDVCLLPTNNSSTGWRYDTAPWVAL